MPRVRLFLWYDREAPETGLRTLSTLGQVGGPRGTPTRGFDDSSTIA